MNPFNCSTYRGVRVFSAMVLGLVAWAGISPGPARGAIASANYFYPLAPDATWTYRQTYWGLSNAVVRTGWSVAVKPFSCDATTGANSLPANSCQKWSRKFFSALLIEPW